MAAGTSVLSAFTFVCVVEHAEAHEAPFGTGVYASPTGLVIRMSRGLVLGSSELQEYRFLCNEALGIAEYDAPSVLVRGDGSLLVGTSSGLKHVSADGCAIERSTALGKARVSALVRDPTDSARVYAATDAGFYVSDDEALRFVELDAHAFDSLEVPDDGGDLVLATGKLGTQAYIARWRSSDPLELQELALGPNEYGVALLGSHAEHVIAVARAYLGTPYPDRLLVSQDGARSWHNPWAAPGIAAFAVDHRSGAWLVGHGTGLWRTSASGESPEQLGSAAVSCLASVSAQLYICDAAGVSVSADGGEHTRSLLRWNEVAGLAACPADAPAVQLCQAAWEDWARELPRDLEPPLQAAKSSTSEPEGAAAVSCSASASLRPMRASFWQLWLTLLLLVIRIMQPRRPSMTTTVLAVILTLGLVSGCAKDSKHAEAGSTQSDAGPSGPVRDSGTALEPNRIEDAAQGGMPDSGKGQLTRPDASPAAGSGSGGRTSAEAAGSAQTPPPDAGARPSEPDSDAGPGEPGALCAACGGCEEIIEVVSAMHTNQPVTYRDPPPTSGPHNPCWGRWGVHDEPLAAERWVHNLEHGGVVFLYNCPDGCEQEVASITQINRHRHRTIVTAYADLPTRFGVVSWGHRLLSDCLDVDTFNAFYERNFDHGPESNANPPNPTCPP